MSDSQKHKPAADAADPYVEHLRQHGVSEGEIEAALAARQVRDQRFANMMRRPDDDDE